MSEGTISLGLLIYGGIALWASAFFIWPAVARARFAYEVARIRNDVDDAIIEGRLPDDPCVRELVGTADFMIRNSRSISLSRAWAIHRTHVELGLPLTDKPSYESLTKPQRRAMYEYDNRMIAAMSKRLVYGSMIALPLRLALSGVRLNQSLRAAVKSPGPQQLASEVYRNKDRRELQVA
jgi:hypothetical protein